ncbi:methyltransferase regulatory domain-containing protein [Planktomarina sp.]|nr:methyltransferase regulatory domain-containing protein [Planktomarina sp.]
MDNWTDGYVTDLSYTFGYYDEMNPVRIAYLLKYAGYQVPQISNAFEMGIGQGISVNIHSLTSDINWSGNDFNPEQVTFAKQLAELTNAQLTDQSFKELTEDDTCLRFDYICLHGIWSWINDENRKNIVKFCQNRLNVGGILYISYNTRPGHAAMVPVRKLMLEYSDITLASSASNNTKIDKSLNFIDSLRDVGAKFFEVNGSLNDKIKSIKSKPVNYVAHEYFNRDWEPMDITETADFLAPAKLTYLGSADYIHQIPELNYTKEQLGLLAKLDNKIFAEKVGDYITNSQFRKDIWVRGGEKVSDFERLDNLSAQSFCLTNNSDEFEYVVNGLSGVANLQEKIYKPIIDLFRSHSILTNRDIFNKLKDKHISLTAICEATMVLCVKKVVSPCYSVSDAKKNRAACKKFNSKICSYSKYRKGHNTLASPVTGGGVGVSKFSQMFVGYFLDGNSEKDPDRVVRYVDELLRSSGQKVQKDGQTLESDESQLSYITELVNKFLTSELHFLKRLMIL